MDDIDVNAHYSGKQLDDELNSTDKDVSMKWDYSLGVDLYGREYLVLPYMDEEKSTLLFDLKTQQWMGVLYIDKVQLYSITDAGSNLQKESIFTPPLKLVFNTLKKID